MPRGPEYVGTERRRTERLRCRVYTDYKVVKSSVSLEEGERLCPVRNWSIGGIRLTVKNLLHVGDIIELDLGLEQDVKKSYPRFNPQARVTWVMKRKHGPGYRIGCEFVDRDYSFQRTMEAVIARTAQRPSEFQRGLDKEKRHFKRLRSNITFDYRKSRFLGFGRQKERECPIRNWSEGGFRATIKEPLSVGDLIEIKFNVPSQTRSIPGWLKPKARVAWITGRPNAIGYRIGCQYVGVSKRVEKELKALVIDVLINISGY